MRQCNSRTLDLVTWAVLSGCRLFGRVRVVQMNRRIGLLATEYIPEYDFVALTPVEATQSILSAVQDTKFPISSMCCPDDYGESVPFWPDLNRGSFAFVAYIASAILTGNPKGLRVYCDAALPQLIQEESNADGGGFLRAHAQERVQSREFQSFTAPIARSLLVDPERFGDAFALAYAVFRRHSMALWNSQDQNTTPYFSSNSFLSGSKQLTGSSRADVLGIVPVLDLASHSFAPNTTIGFPDHEMLQWIQQERHLSTPASSQGCMVLQATRGIEPDELITVNKNACFNLDEELFSMWFGIPLHSFPRNDSSLGASDDVGSPRDGASDLHTLLDRSSVEGLDEDIR